MMETLRPLLARSALQGSTGTSRVLKAGVASIKLLEYRAARFLVAPLFHARNPVRMPVSPQGCRGRYLSHGLRQVPRGHVLHGARSQRLVPVQ